VHIHSIAEPKKLPKFYSKRKGQYNKIISYRFLESKDPHEANHKDLAQWQDQEWEIAH
jgi:hypothetical protein